jgi:hypothetical protein
MEAMIGFSSTTLFSMLRGRSTTGGGEDDAKARVQDVQRKLGEFVGVAQVLAGGTPAAAVTITALKPVSECVACKGQGVSGLRDAAVDPASLAGCLLASVVAG